MTFASMLVVIVTCSAAANAASERLQSPHLSPSVTDTEMRFGEEEMGLALYGRVDGGSILKLGRILTQHTADETELSVGEVAVETFAQGRGVATALYDYAIRRQERINQVRVKKITASSYVGGNLDPVLVRLTHELRQAPGYVPPGPAQTPERKFLACCAKIYLAHPEEIAKAITYSPSYRVARKLGFSLCPGSDSFRVEKSGIKLNYDMCR